MEPDKGDGLAAAERSAAVTRAGGVNEPPVEALRDHQPEKHGSGWSRGVIVGLGVILTLGALGYFYFNSDAERETASAPATEQAPPPASKDVAAATPPADEPVRPPAAPQQVASPAPPAAPPAQTPPPAPSTATSGASSVSSPPPGAERRAAQTAAPAQVQVPPPPQAPAQAPAAASSAPVESAAQPPRQADSLTNQPASLPAEESVFVQKPRVNIRAEPDRRGRVVGSASKGQQFKVVGRSGTWVQVEGDGRKGWIGGRMLGPQSP